MKLIYITKEFRIPETKPIIQRNACDRLTLDETIRLGSAASIIGHHFYNFDRFGAVDGSYEEFFDACKINNNDIHKGQIVERRARTFLFEFALYLDHYKTYISHSDLDKDAYLKLYEDLTHDAYDGNIEYRLMFCFRNAATHCTDIVTAKLEGEDNEYYEPLVYRDILLSNKKLKAKDKEDLKAWPAKTISLTAVFSKAHSLLKGIHEKLVLFEIDDSTKSDCEFVLDCYGKVCDIQSSSWAIEYPEKHLMESVDQFGNIIERITDVHRQRDIVWPQLVETANRILELYKE